MLDEEGLSRAISVDGRIDPTAASPMAQAGSAVLIVGSSIFNRSGVVRKNITALRMSFRTYPREN
jgi:pentose-5-phosphate-3-epimerase